MVDAWALTTEQRAEVLKLIAASKREDRQRQSRRIRPVIKADDNFLAWIDTTAIPAATGTAPDNLLVGSLDNVEVYRYNENDGKLTAYTENGETLTHTVKNYDTSESPTSSFVHVHRDNFGQFWFDPTGEATPEGFAYQNEFGSSEPVPEHGVITMYPRGLGQTDHLSASYTTQYARSGAVPNCSYLENDFDDIQDEWVYFLNSNATVAAGENGRAYTATGKPRWARLHSNVTNPDIDGINTGELWGPLPGQTGDEFSLWKGAPGFRTVTGAQEFETIAGSEWYWAAQVTRDTGPFWVVAEENWDLDPSNEEYSILVKLIEHPNSVPELHNSDFHSDHSSLIYDGHDSDHPDVEFRVKLPCGDDRHPNIERGQIFEVRFQHNTNASGGSSHQCVIVSQGWDSPLIGSYELRVDPCGDDLTNGSVPQGWALADGTANSIGNGGNAVDMRGRFIVGVDDRGGGVPSHSDSNYTQGNTGGNKTHSHTVNTTDVTDLDKDGFDNFTAHLVNSTSDENHVPPWVAAYYLERLDNSESGFTRGSY